MKSKTINYDSQGWPERSKSIKEIIMALGGVYNSETGNWEIRDNESLNEVPVILHDDGMGYGVDPEYIYEISSNNTGSLVMFADEAIPHIEVWEECLLQPGVSIEYNNAKWIPLRVDKTPNELMFVFYEEPIDGARANLTKTISLPIEIVKSITKHI